MFCNKCGKQIEDESKFCSFCGTAIPNSFQQNETQNTTENLETGIPTKLENTVQPLETECIEQKTPETENQEQKEQVNVDTNTDEQTKPKLSRNKIMIIASICIIVFAAAFYFSFIIPLQQSKQNLSEVVVAAPAQYANYIMDDFSEEYQKLLQESQTALNENNQHTMKSLIKQWSDFENNVLQQNEIILSEKQKQIESMDVSLAYDEEKELIENYKT